MFGNCFTFSRAKFALILLALFGHAFAQEPQDADAPVEPKAKRSTLPTIDQLMKSKLEALRSGLAEQEILIGKATKELEKEKGLEQKVYDNNAYFSLSMKNTAPSGQYRLEKTEIFLDGKSKPIAQGGKHNQGEPRKHELYFGPISAGCHELKVKAHYVRLKNDLIRQFGVDRIERIETIQTFLATSGYRVEIEVEGYERINTFANFYRGPDVRFNKSARPNFLPGAPIVTMDDVLKQGRLRINYITEDESNHRLLSKNLSIDGLPIMHEEKQDKDGAIIFDAPLAPGKHRLSASLVFTEKKWVHGGPSYNFKLNFEQDFFVISGQSTIIDLAGMPKGGIKSSLADTRYARSTTRILSKEYSEFFPVERCAELKKATRVIEPAKPEPKVEPVAPVEEVKTVEPEAAPVEPVEPVEAVNELGVPEEDKKNGPDHKEVVPPEKAPEVKEPAREKAPRAKEKAGE